MHQTAFALLASFPVLCAAVDTASLTCKPQEAKPSAVVSLTFASGTSTSGRPYVRLVGKALSQVSQDIVVAADDVKRGLVNIPVPPLARGAYDVSLRAESGAVLAQGSELRVLASDAPVVRAIEPRVSYPNLDDEYAFEIVGEKFADRAEDNHVHINGVLVAFRTYVNDPDHRISSCARPCLVRGRDSLRVYGLTEGNAYGSPDAQAARAQAQRRPGTSMESPPPLGVQRLSRPMYITVEVDGMSSTPQQLILSPVRRFTPAGFAIGTLVVAVLLVVLLAAAITRNRPQGAPGAHPLLRFLLIDPATNTYSLSKLQLLLWSGASLLTYVFLAASRSFVQWRWGLPPVPEGLPAMIGVSVGTSALAAGIAEARGSKGAGPVEPGLADFFTTGGVFAPERFQFFVWTLVGVLGFLVATLVQEPATITELPKIPEDFLPLMGVSSLGYVACKAVRKAGPIVKSVTAIPTAFPGKVQIVGENLSPRAEVRINGVPIPPGQVTVGEGEDARAEFVLKLSVALPDKDQVSRAQRGVPTLKVTNPDGQAAEFNSPAPNVARKPDIPKDGVGKVVIEGENLSPRAKVRIWGKLVPADRVKPGERERPSADFVSTLLVELTADDKMNVSTVSAPILEVTNPDGQSVEVR